MLCIFNDVISTPRDMLNIVYLFLRRMFRSSGFHFFIFGGHVFIFLSLLSIILSSFLSFCLLYYVFRYTSPLSPMSFFRPFMSIYLPILSTWPITMMDQLLNLVM